MCLSVGCISLTEYILNFKCTVSVFRTKLKLLTITFMENVPLLKKNRIQDKVTWGTLLLYCSSNELETILSTLTLCNRKRIKMTCAKVKAIKRSAAENARMFNYHSKRVEPSK